MSSKWSNRLPGETRRDFYTQALLTTPRLSLEWASSICLQVTSHKSPKLLRQCVPEIHEEAGAFTVADIDTAFTLVMPTQDQYEGYDIRADIKKFKDIGDASRIAMILQVISHIFKLIGLISSDCSG